MTRACPQCPIPYWRNEFPLDSYAELSYEHLAEYRSYAVKLRDSKVVFIHDRVHLQELVDRIDAAVKLKRDREAYWKKKNRTAQ
jgi:hypothetical protein